MHCEASRKIYVEFGEVETSATAIKWLEIVNESCVSVLITMIQGRSSFGWLERMRLKIKISIF